MSIKFPVPNVPAWRRADFALEIAKRGQYHLPRRWRRSHAAPCWEEQLRMPASVFEWHNLILRWIHVLAGVFWIGQTYYFTKLEGRMAADEEAARATGRAPQVWMVHSGSFSLVERQTSPKLLPTKLYWFRWEALITWVSGFLLLVLLYYSGGLLLDDSVSSIGLWTGIAIGLATLILGFTVYEGLWMSPLGRSPILAATTSYLLVVALAYGLTHVLSGRAAYIHVGALFGTIMTANVWMTILPATRKMLASLREGKPPNLQLAERAKRCTIHNTYMTVPLIFIMISNHFPTATYGRTDSWLILSALVLAGGVAAHWIYKP